MSNAETEIRKPPLRRVRAVRILAVLLAIPLFGAAVGYVWINRVADRRWSAAQARIRQIVALHSAEPTRPPTVTDRSREIESHFVAAIREAVRRLNRAEDVGVSVQYRKSGEAVDVALGDSQEFLVRVHQGARLCVASPSDFPPRWQGELDYGALNFMMNCGVLRARRSLERNEPDEAVETLLNSLHLARFWGESGKGTKRRSAIEGVVWTLEELRIVLSSEQPSPEMLLAMDRELELLDRAMPWEYSDLEPALARWGEEMLAWKEGEWSSVRDAPLRWKYLLPERLMKAEAFELCDRLTGLLGACEGKPDPEVAKVFRSIEADWSGNPILQDGAFFTTLKRWREVRRRAEFRVLRAAARYRANGELPELEDPFGGKILHSKTESRTRFWSLDLDRRDNGGDGGDGRWAVATIGLPAPHPPLREKNPTRRPVKDIVIEVPRR